MSTLAEFKAKITKAGKPGRIKISGSYKTRKTHKRYVKMRPKEPQFLISRQQYESIINEMNILLVDKLIENGRISLPLGFGVVYIDKTEYKSWFDEDGKFATTRQVDMAKTHELWHNDEEARKNGTVIRYENDEVFKIKYSTKWRTYANNKYFTIQFCRNLKRNKLKNAILNNNFDTYKKREFRWVKRNT